MKTLNEVDKRLIAAIHDEKTYFSMADFVRPGASEHVPATCDTASCMAGHIVAMYTEVAKRAVTENSGIIDHESLAQLVYKKVTGEECRLDFYAWGMGRNLSNITRDEVILHIAGINPEWPLEDL